MSTIGGKFAEYGLGLTFQDLPAEVIKQAKRLVLDTIGCAIGGYTSDASRILISAIPDLGGTAESTIIGSGIKTSCANAALANGVMVRFLDLNDGYIIAKPVLTGTHPSEIIPPIFAVGERQRSSGKQVIEAMVAGYELSARFNDACTVNKSIEHKGWNIDLRAGFIVPVVVGKLLGLNAEEIENAIGIAGSLNMVLGILDAPKEEYTMSKNLRFPFTAYDAIIASILAQKGFTGPKKVIEGQRGFVESVMGGDFDFKKCTDFNGFRIMQTSFKSFPSDGTTHGHLTATLQLVKENDIKPEDVAQVRIFASSRDVEHTGQPEKRYPHNKETADHSSYYLTAVAISDREVSSRQYTSAKYDDPRIRELNDKVIFEADPSLDNLPTAGISEITTKQGKTYKKRVDYPRGEPRNPMTDKELEDKFRSLATDFMMDTQISDVINTIDQLDTLTDISILMEKLSLFSLLEARLI
ncbi:MAG: MmgE/PrpD family protein [Dehalococcoidia bacterium]